MEKPHLPMLTEKQCDEIKRIKSQIHDMLAERQALPQDKADPPSRYWSDFCGYFDYMLTLPEQSFAKLRLHTYHLNGDNYQRYYFGMMDFLSPDYIDRLARDVPAEFVFDEPEGGIGFHYPNGRFVSMDIARYQEVVNSLYRTGIIPFRESSNPEKRDFVLEIGGGYGGLGHHLSRILHPITYVLIDLPETLLFQASYLYLHNPGKKIYLYDKNFKDFINSDEASSYDFILVPNYQLDLLRRRRFKLALNMLSFMEMRKEQVVAYLNFIAETCPGVLYSFNQYRNGFNYELSDLTQLLKERFALQNPSVQDKNSLKQMAKKLRASLRKLYAKKQGVDNSYQEYICRPLSMKGNPS